MKINKIVLYNFNSYEGLNEFDFTCENNSKNIILIGGKNGAGKTSLFTAIKIALYGPLSFGYVGVNPKYIAKIKDCINSRAFQKDVVRSKVQISVSLTVEREIKEYEITREWDYTKQKLDEKYYVKTEDRFLDGQELSYFQNYLQSMIPPDLFEFFLFDGEEVGSIFSTSTYNSYVKNAVYTLCGLDVFEIIRKYTTGYAGKASSKDEEKIYSHYKELRKNADEIDISFADLEAQIASDKNELEKVETELIEIETAFKNAGGITEVERQALMKEFTEAEHTKTESLTKIKMFVEGLMPFIILRDFTGRITEQLDFEEKGEIYYYVQQKLKRQEIKKALNEKQEVSEDTVEALMDFLLKKFKPKGFKEGAQSVHDLSKEDLGRVTIVIVPTVSLAIDQVRNAKNNIKHNADNEIFCYYSGIELERKNALRNAIKSETARLLFISPEALIRNTEFVSMINEANIKKYLKNLIVDEAHIAIEWGDFFRVDYQCLEPWHNELLAINSQLRTVLLSATFTKVAVTKLKQMFASTDKWIEVRCDALRREPRYLLVKAKSYSDKNCKMIELVKKLPHPMVIYINSPKEAEEIKKTLVEGGLDNLETFTGNTKSAERERIIKDWADDKIDLIIATSAFGVGVDKGDVRTVLHLYVPDTPNQYYQELGRGGRDGLVSLSVMCINPIDDIDSAYGRMNIVLKPETIWKRWVFMYKSPKTSWFKGMIHQ